MRAWSRVNHRSPIWTDHESIMVDCRKFASLTKFSFHFCRLVTEHNITYIFITEQITAHFNTQQQQHNNTMAAAFADRIKQFDAYPKTLSDFRVKTLSGATVTAVSAVIMVVLFLAEFHYYLSTGEHNISLLAAAHMFHLIYSLWLHPAM